MAMRVRLVVLASAAWLAIVAATPAPVQLGETRPIETTLGNPNLPEARAVWLEMIRGAKRRLDLEHFYFSHRPGEALQPVVDEIGRAAARGVSVRLLLDAGMYATYPRTADSLARLPGIEVRRVDYRRLAGGVQHAKFMIVDGTATWLGSQNLDWRSLSHIHELGVRVDQPDIAGAMQDVFEVDWAAADTTRALRYPPARSTRWPVRIVQAPGDTAAVWPSASPKRTLPAGIPWDRDILVASLDAARSSIVAQVLQYSTSGRSETDSTIDRALRQAAARGVRVRLIVSDWTQGEGLASLRRLAAEKGIEVRISRMPEWSGGYIPFARVEHCKYAVVDSLWTWIGTSNWEPSYFSSSRNVAVTIRNRPIALEALRAFASSWDEPHVLPLRAGVEVPQRPHRETPPPGVRVYGE